MVPARIGAEDPDRQVEVFRVLVDLNAISRDLGFVCLGGLTKMDPTAECRLIFGANPDRRSS